MVNLKNRFPLQHTRILRHHHAAPKFVKRLQFQKKLVLPESPVCAGRSHLQVVVAPEQVLDLPPKICVGHANLLFHLPLSKVATLCAVSLGHEVVCDVDQLVEEDQQAEVAAVPFAASLALEVAVVLCALEALSVVSEMA